MKQVKLETKRILVVYNILNAAKYTKCEDADTIKILKIVRAMKPIAEKFQKDTDDVTKALKPSEFDDKLQKWEETRQKLANGVKDDLPMTPKEFVEFNFGVIIPFNKKVEDGNKEYTDAEAEIEFEPISESALTKLMNSNNWNFAQVAELADVICE